MFKRFRKLKKGAAAADFFEQQRVISSKQEDSGEKMKKEVSRAERTVYLFPASMKKVGGNRWGYIDVNGKFVLPPIYDHAGNFQENGLAVVQLNGLSGLININGYFIVNPKYDAINPFSEGRAAVVTPQGFNVIDESGKELLPNEYAYIGDYREGRALFADIDKTGSYLSGFLNKRGKEVIPPIYEIASDFNDGKAVVKLKGGAYGLINLTGKILYTFPYAFAGYYSEALLGFQKTADDQFGYMDEQGKIVIEPKFTGIQPFKEGKAIVNVNGHYGLIDRRGRYIFKPNYHHMLHLGEDRIAIGKAVDPEKPAFGSIYAIADTAGHIYTGFIYNSISIFEDGKASAYNDESTFFIDRNGNIIHELPIVSGNGKLHFEKKLIKAEIDTRLFYFDKNRFPVWKQNTEMCLNDQYTVIENKYKPNKDFIVYYPQLNGVNDRKTQAKVNQNLKDLAGIKETSPSLQLESNYKGDYDITVYKSDLVVIEIFGWNSPFATAQGLPVKKYIHLNLKTGEILQLRDMFKSGSQFIKVISEIISEQIKYNRKYSYIFPRSYKGIQADQPFYISKGHLNIYFSPCELAPCTAGFPVFSIPFEELISIIDQTNSFWNAFK